MLEIKYITHIVILQKYRSNIATYWKYNNYSSNILQLLYFYNMCYMNVLYILRVHLKYKKRIYNDKIIIYTVFAFI